MKNIAFIALGFLVFFATSCKQNKPLYTIEKSVQADTAMVVSAHPLASEVGRTILRQGGNAVDAAVAIQFALAVVCPRAGNIGGGGFMIIRTNKGDYTALDYREKAPLQASRDMYLDSLGNIIDGISRTGHLSVGVPGTVAGMVAAHQKYGKLKEFKTLLAPAIALAKNGFQVTYEESERLNKYKEDFLKNNLETIPFLKPSPWKEGDMLVQEDLAHSLQLIHDKGRDGFYKGETAHKIVAEMMTGNGLITHQDLQKYQARWRTPVVEPYKNYKLISMPPPSSGGLALAQLLKIVENYPLAEYGFHSPQAVHLMAEAERRVYADRAQHLGDTDFYPVPQDSLLDVGYLAERMADFDTQLATQSDSILAGNFKPLPESFETTHTSVIDADGNAVAVTTTLNLNYGSKIVVDGAGFFLNDEMDDFSAKPGVPNYYGLVGAEANAIQPEKRMLSSMTPTIFEKDGELFMVLGSPGGSTIITAVFQVFLNVVEFGMPLDEAVNAGRFHHQWLPDQILVEEGVLSAETRAALTGFGHEFKEKKYLAKIKAIQVLPDGKLHGVGDKRNADDAAVGY